MSRLRLLASMLLWCRSGKAMRSLPHTASLSDLALCSSDHAEEQVAAMPDNTLANTESAVSAPPTTSKTNSSSEDRSGLAPTSDQVASTIVPTGVDNALGIYDGVNPCNSDEVECEAPFKVRVTRSKLLMGRQKSGTCAVVETSKESASTAARTEDTRGTRTVENFSESCPPFNWQSMQKTPMNKQQEYPASDPGEDSPDHISHDSRRVGEEVQELGPIQSDKK